MMIYFGIFTIFFIYLSHSSVHAEEGLQYYDDPSEDNLGEIEEREKNKTYHLWMRQIERDVLKAVSSREPPFTEGRQLDVQFIFHGVDHVYIEEREQVMGVMGRYCLVWRDPRIKWDPSKYNDIDTMHVGPYDVWVPKINVLYSLTGVRSFKDAAVSHVKIYTPRFRPNEPAYIITCPRYTVRVGCSLDLSNYPNDIHYCSFVLANSVGIHQVTLSSGRRYGYNRDFTVNLRHVLTRNDTRPLVSDWNIQNVTSKIKFFDGETISDVKQTSFSTTVAVQTVVFRRHAPYFYCTVAVPSLLFASMNVAAALCIDSSHTMGIFLLEIFFLILFLRDFINELPLYYRSLPRIMQFWIVHLSLGIFGFTYVLIKEILRRYRNEAHVVVKLPDEWSKKCLLNMIFSLAGTYITITALSVIIFLI